MDFCSQLLARTLILTNVNLEKISTGNFFRRSINLLQTYLTVRQRALKRANDRCNVIIKSSSCNFRLHGKKINPGTKDCNR